MGGKQRSKDGVSACKPHRPCYNWGIRSSAWSYRGISVTDKIQKG